MPFGAVTLADLSPNPIKMTNKKCEVCGKRSVDRYVRVGGERNSIQIEVCGKCRNEVVPTERKQLIEFVYKTKYPSKSLKDINTFVGALRGY